MVKGKKVDDTKKEIKGTLTDLLTKLKIEAASKIVEESDSSSVDKTSHFKVNIETKDSGLLIGRFGETINSLQLLLGVILYKKLGTWVRVVLDIGDYRKVREASIKEMVNRIVAEVEKTNQPVILPYLTPLERRTVHLMLADNPKATSESNGLGRDRRITIKPR